MPSFYLPPIVIHRRFAPAELSERLGYWIADYNLHRLWHSMGRGQGIRVGVCDTGIDETHLGPQGDLSGAVVAAKDFTRSAVGSRDVHGHGTHVAGIIAARTGNRRGIAGVAPAAELVIAKVLGDSGSGNDEAVASGINFCLENGCQVINCSLGGPQPSPVIEVAIKRALVKGAIVVCAAGNEGGRVGYPAANASNLCIGAIDAKRVLANFSNRGNEVDFVAPGVEIVSTYLNGGYATLSGTSMATPWISGLLALWIGRGGDRATLKGDTANLKTVRDALASAAIDLGPAGRDIGYGHGLPQPSDFLEATASAKPTAPGTTTWKISSGTLEVMSP